VSERSDEALASKIYNGSEYVPFGEMTAEAARERYTALKEATGFGPTMRVRPVAEGWRTLAIELEESGAATVAQLTPEQIEDYAQKVWVIQPSGGFLSDPKGSAGPPASPPSDEKPPGR
jgi:hypothetical protein